MKKTERVNKNRGPAVALISSLQPGEIFYTTLQPKGVTAISTFYGIKVKTEVCLVITEYRRPAPKIERLTKVTIL